MKRMNEWDNSVSPFHYSIDYKRNSSGNMVLHHCGIQKYLSFSKFIQKKRQNEANKRKRYDKKQMLELQKQKKKKKKNWKERGRYSIVQRIIWRRGNDMLLLWFWHHTILSKFISISNVIHTSNSASIALMQRNNFESNTPKWAEILPVHSTVNERVLVWWVIWVRLSIHRDDVRYYKSVENSG